MDKDSVFQFEIVKLITAARTHDRPSSSDSPGRIGRSPTTSWRRSAPGLRRPSTLGLAYIKLSTSICKPGPSPHRKAAAAAIHTHAGKERPRPCRLSPSMPRRRPATRRRTQTSTATMPASCRRCSHTHTPGAPFLI